MQCSPQCVHSKPVMHKQGDARRHVCTAGAWRGLDRQALEGCLGVVALALGVVMAGTGHLPTLQLLRGGSAFLDTSSLPLIGPYHPLSPAQSPPPPNPQTAFPFFVMHSVPYGVILFLTPLLCFLPAPASSSFSLPSFCLSRLMSSTPVSFVLAYIHSACNQTPSTCIAYPEHT